MEPVWAIGLMTGTVLDGNIDVAMLRTDGERIDAFGPLDLMPYGTDLRTLLAQTLDAARAWQFEGPEPPLFAAAERALTEAQANAVLAFLAKHDRRPNELAAVGFHGQTVLHRAPADGRQGRTRQLGDGQRMADMLGVPVVYDFRSADMAAGGNGAPLAPVYHRALLGRAGAGAETVVLNLGGVANLTFIQGDRMVAFDTGPANAPINDWVKRHGLGDMDADGALARTGTVDEDRLAALLRHPYLAAPFPKSLDRFDFSAAMADGLSPADGAATLTAFTAAAVAAALDHLPVRPTRMVVCGGGRKNPVLMEELRRRTGAEAVPAEDLGLRGDGVEAECFAFLAVRALRGLPISFPETTGAPEPMTGGVVARPRKG